MSSRGWNRKVAVLTEYLKQNVERLAVEKKEFDAFDHRLKALQSGIAERRGPHGRPAVARRGWSSALAQRIDGIGRDFQILGGQADALAQKQTTLESLAERLAEVDELSKRTLTQQDALLKSRADLEQVRLEIQDLHQAHVEAARLADTLGRDRAALEAFAAQATALLREGAGTRVPDGRRARPDGPRRRGHQVRCTPG